MTKEEAEALAFKREAHKSKHLTQKRWSAAHNSVKGWHVALVDNHAPIVAEKTNEARAALMRGDMDRFYDAASARLLARCRALLEDLG